MPETAANDAPMVQAHHCPTAVVLDLIGHKWTVAIFHRLDAAPGPVRFRQLQRLVGAITQKELTKRLRELERSGLVARAVFAEVPPRVEYQLTDLGRSLRPAMAGLQDWAVGNADLVAENQRRSDEARAAVEAGR